MIDLGSEGNWKIGEAGLGGGVSSSSDDNISGDFGLAGFTILGDFGFVGVKIVGDFVLL